mgnify:CR=1 FL=1
MEVALKVLFVSTVIAISGFFFLAISDLQAKQGLTQYQISELIKAQDLHSKMLEDQLVKLTVISDKLHAQFNW